MAASIRVLLLVSVALVLRQVSFVPGPSTLRSATRATQRGRRQQLSTATTRGATSAAEVLQSIEASVPADSFKDAVVVVKYGGHAMKNEAGFAADIVALQSLGVRPVVVHGGGPQIKAMLEKLQLPSQFHNGLRISDAATVEVAEMVLGRLNKGLVAAIVAAGGRAVGLSGKDDGMIRTRKVIGDDGVDIGFVGEAEKIDTTLVNALLSMSPSVIPVIAPLGIGLTDGATYNINADTMAGAVAGALKADRLLLLTDVAGVLDGPPDDGGKLLPRLTRARVEELISGGTIYGGMIPKVQNALDAVEAGSGGASIVDGRETHAIFRALYTDSGGTLVEAS